MRPDWLPSWYDPDGIWAAGFGLNSPEFIEGAEPPAGKSRPPLGLQQGWSMSQRLMTAVHNLPKSRAAALVGHMRGLRRLGDVPQPGPSPLFTSAEGAQRLLRVANAMLRRHADALAPNQQRAALGYAAFAGQRRYVGVPYLLSYPARGRAPVDTWDKIRPTVRFLNLMCLQAYEWLKAANALPPRHLAGHERANADGQGYLPAPVAGGAGFPISGALAFQALETDDPAGEIESYLRHVWGDFAVTRTINLRIQEDKAWQPLIEPDTRSPRLAGRVLGWTKGGLGRIRALRIPPRPVSLAMVPARLTTDWLMKYVLPKYLMTAPAHIIRSAAAVVSSTVGLPPPPPVTPNMAFLAAGGVFRGARPAMNLLRGISLLSPGKSIWPADVSQFDTMVPVTVVDGLREAQREALRPIIGQRLAFTPPKLRTIIPNPVGPLRIHTSDAGLDEGLVGSGEQDTNTNGRQCCWGVTATAVAPYAHPIELLCGCGDVGYVNEGDDQAVVCNPKIMPDIAARATAIGLPLDAPSPDEPVVLLQQAWDTEPVVDPGPFVDIHGYTVGLYTVRTPDGKVWSTSSNVMRVVVHTFNDDYPVTTSWPAWAFAARDALMGLPLDWRELAAHMLAAVIRESVAMGEAAPESSSTRSELIARPADFLLRLCESDSWESTTVALELELHRSPSMKQMLSRLFRDHGYDTDAEYWTTLGFRPDAAEALARLAASKGRRAAVGWKSMDPLDLSLTVELPDNTYQPGLGYAAFDAAVEAALAHTRHSLTADDLEFVYG